jgi:hypothetical protein
MESQLSVLLYSKYSSLSKNLMNMIQTSGVDFTTKFSLQHLCIDNEEIRSRILKNTQLQITTVPCLLITFPDGGIEKYEGSKVFEWVEGIIRQFAPPPSPTPPVQQEQVQSEEEKWRIQQASEKQRVQQTKENERKRISDENRRKYNEKYDESRTPSPEKEKHRSTSPKRRSRVKKEFRETEKHQEKQRDTGVTSIDDLDDLDDLDELPSDEDDERSSDRYRSRKPVGRIRTNDGNYEENEDLFKGNPPNTRKTIKSKGKDAKSEKSIDLMTKAKEMAKGREDTEQKPPPGHPAGKLN